MKVLLLTVLAVVIGVIVAKKIQNSVPSLA